LIETVVTTNVDPELVTQVKKILKVKNLINLKSQFVMVSSVLNHLIQEPEDCQKSVAEAILALLKEIDT
jgi:hypothetical protein